MKVSLGTKIVVMLIVFAIVLSGVSMIVGYRTTDDMNSRHYMDRADEIAATVSRVVDADAVASFKGKVLEIYESAPSHPTSAEWGSPEFEEYAALFEGLYNEPEYKTILSQLRSLQEVNDVDCLYVSFVDTVEKRCVYLVDAAEEEPCPIGCIDPLYEVNYEVIDNPARGFPAYITDTAEYGWLVSAAAPVYGEGGEVIAYAFDDISMEVIKQQEADHLMGLGGGLLILTVVLCLVAILFVRRSVVRPINVLSKAAERYCAPEEGQRSTFEDIDIHTRDEIENLHKSMIQMEHDIDTYIDHLVETRAQLKDTRQRAEHLDVLAHKDALTGIRNKLAYDQEALALEQEIKEGKTAFGIAVIDLNDLKTINDVYGHDRGNVSLIKISKMICAVFSHSAVFRIGGDEFAVVLRENDFESIDGLVKEFQSVLDMQQDDSRGDLEPWERISAAIGYATYDPDLDASVDSVFRRADQQMYERKKQMKGEGISR